MIAKTCMPARMTLDTVGTLKAVKSTRLALLISNPADPDNETIFEIRIKERAWWEIWLHKFEVDIDLVIYDDPVRALYKERNNAADKV